MLGLNEARDDGVEWPPLDHMQIACILLQTYIYFSNFSLNFFALSEAQSTNVKAQKAMTASCLVDY